MSTRTIRALRGEWNDQEKDDRVEVCRCRNLLLTAATLAAGDASAGVVRCETCRTDSDYRDAAVRLGPGTHLVYNVAANQIQQYYVGRDADDDGDEADAAGEEGSVMERPVSRPASQKN